jgi:hypothetical protein
MANLTASGGSGSWSRSSGSDPSGRGKDGVAINGGIPSRIVAPCLRWHGKPELDDVPGEDHKSVVDPRGKFRGQFI